MLEGRKEKKREMNEMDNRNKM
jgi:hypothetical protein